MMARAILLLQETQLAVRLCRGIFDETQGIDQFPSKPPAADREVFDGPLRLSAVVGLFGDLDRIPWNPFLIDRNWMKQP